jgi:hypothetical protein
MCACHIKQETIKIQVIPYFLRLAANNKTRAHNISSEGFEINNSIMCRATDVALTTKIFSMHVKSDWSALCMFPQGIIQIKTLQTAAKFAYALGNR